MKKTAYILTNLIIMFLLMSFFCFAAANAKKQKKIDFYDFKADTIIANENYITASGNVVFSQDDIIIKAQKVNFDLKSNLLTADGKVAVEYKNDRFSGQRLLYDAAKYEATLYDLSGFTQSLSFAEGALRGKLIFSARKLLSTPQELNLYKVKATTCDNPKPHYYILAKQITVFPEDKLIIRDASFYSDDKHVFSVPSVVYSLRPQDSRQRFQSAIPKISSNDVDGLTVKESLNYIAGKRDYGTVNIDWHDKTGFGFGLDHYFNFKDKGDGAIHYYKMGSASQNSSRYEYGARLNYLLPMDTKLAYSFSSNLYQIPGVANFPVKSSFFSLNRAGDRSNFVLSSTLYNLAFNLNQGYNLYHTYNISNSLKSFLYFDYSKNRSTSGETYNTHPVLRLYDKGKFFDTQISYERTGGSIQNGLDREPEVSLISHRLVTKFLDFQASGSYGLFREKPQTTRISRSYLEAALPYKLWKISPNGYIDSHSFANKYWYNNGQSYRVFSNRTGVFYGLTKFSNARFDFFYQSPKGGAPIQQDRLSYYKLLLGNLSVFDTKNYILNFGTSYDLTAKRWQELICRFGLTPGDFGSLNFGVNYDTQRKKWLNLDSQFDVMLGKTINLRYWSEYDIQNRRLITQDYSVIKDFHCWEARVVYRGFANQWWFDVVLKAFPSEDITVGANQTKPILPEEGWQKF